MKPTLGILLEFGFHEIKKYIHSGFSKKAGKKFNIIWFYIDKGSEEFDEYLRETGFPMIKIDESKLRRGISRIEARNNSVRRAWMVSNRLGAFHNYKLIKKRTIRNKIMGTYLLKKLYEIQVLKEISIVYNSPYLIELFTEHKIQHLLATGYSSVIAKSAIVTVRNSDIKMWYLVNSWKDLYINNFIPVDSLDGIFVWSEEMRNNYLRHMPYLKNNHFVITGNPTFDALIKHKGVHPKKFYAKKYNILQSAKWVIYTLMPPGINNNEIETALLLAGKVGKHYSKEEVVILLRRNPNHDIKDFTDLDLPENVVLTEHFCTYDKEKDLIIQSKEGEEEWLDLLHYVDFNINVPSTVTLEFLALGKPVLNIGFGPDGKFNELVSQHFEAGFYRGLFISSPLVHKVTDINQLMDKFDMCLKSSKDKFDNQVLAERGFATDKIIQSIN